MGQCLDVIVPKSGEILLEWDSTPALDFVADAILANALALHLDLDAVMAEEKCFVWLPLS